MQTDKETIHILVAENLPIVRDGLIAQLGRITSIHIHAVAVSSKQSLGSLLAVRQFDFLFVSPRFDGGFQLSDFKQNHPNIPCIAILSSLEMLEKADGFYGYISVFDSVEKISRLIENYKDNPHEEHMEESPDLLSSREKEILINLAKGLSNKEVADKLFLSVYTVMTHRRNICRKLKIHSLSGLTIYAIANKLIEM
ncbi:MAG: response regulator transcription factor [Bacteroidaceae bacterium]|nr:response regulator transcription factor [Bacteroidaceae bacterium]